MWGFIVRAVGSHESFSMQVKIPHAQNTLTSCLIHNMK